MGQFDNLPDHASGHDDTNALEILQRVSRHLGELQQDFSGQLAADVERLKAEKSRLVGDINHLQGDYEALQEAYYALKADQEITLSKQQIAQQQLWAKQLAQALASHLQSRLSAPLPPSLPPQPAASQAHDPRSPGALGGVSSHGGVPTSGMSIEHLQRLVSSLDATLGSTLQSLQQDLHSYQSALSQQISRMHNTEQQGEVILEALVNRLSLQLQDHINQVNTQLPVINREASYGAQMQQAPVDQISLPQPSRVPRQSPTDAQPKFGFGSGLSAIQRGLILIILSTLALSFHNVVVSIVGFGARFLGILPLEPVLPLNIPHSLLLLFLRMVVVLPLMAVVAQKLYPKVWEDLRQFLYRGQRLPILQVLSSGFFLFTSQVLIYKAIPDVGPGVAVTLLFMYPLFTVPLAWFLFKDRPSWVRGVVMFAITIGIYLVALPRIVAGLPSVEISGWDILKIWQVIPTIGAAILVNDNFSAWGIVAAILSSIAFALYLVSMQISFRKLHPVPVTLLQFTTILVLTGISVTTLSIFQRLGHPLFGLELQGPSSASGLMVSVLLLGILTLVGYLFNNYGVRLMGAAQASIVASSGPVVTALLAYLLTPGGQSALGFWQWVGIMVVTLGVIALSFERMLLQTQPATSKPRRIKA